VTGGDESDEENGTSEADAAPGVAGRKNAARKRARKRVPEVQP
jgi:hypothetical protein